MITQAVGRVLSNEQVAPGIFLMSLKLPWIAQRAKPGQFIHVRIGSQFRPLLRRPFSIYRADAEREEIQILYQLVGEGTMRLSEKGEGEGLDCLGPIGNGFWFRREDAVLVSGGIGIAPLFFLAEAMLGKMSSDDPRGRGRKVTILIGASSRDYLMRRKELELLGAEVRVATDDGSEGYAGPVTELLAATLQENSDRAFSVFACGPRPMLKEVARITVRRRIPCQLSLEEHMACGVGACLGCAVRTPSGYRRVCVDGPVFDAEEVIL
ncbi:MAG TPA: dihydroorotate dehydrogenase electron transfer subunit [Candidatus Latescibacteria bacterium]|nr:dihydroorotate dehydrogenase electron transfer subunit [Candidatus Latescibacterota bacterium]